MKKRIFSIITLFFWLTSLVLNTVPPTFAQDLSKLSPDVDGDGLLNDLETAGWYNEAGGPFSTSPTDADSDDDGLTDGEEKLFGTDPLDEMDPGIYVRYQNGYMTREYFHGTDPAYLSMKQGGDHALLTEAMVARRGTQLFIGGPISGTLSFTGASFTKTPDLYGGGWLVDIPSAGETGIYTATVSLGGSSQEMPIYVIFEIPATTTDVNEDGFAHELTPDDIEAFLYNNNPSDVRDEVAVIWRTRKVGVEKGFAQAFWTDQYKKYVFVDRVMPRIHGLSSRIVAIDELAHQADEDVRVKYQNYIMTDMVTTLATTCDITGCTQDGSPCQNQAGALSSYLRSAGIPANPFAANWTGSADDDHSVLVWVGDQWKAIRSYVADENSNTTWAIYHPFARVDPISITPLSVLIDWDNNGRYYDSNSDLLMAINAGWDFEEWEPNPEFPDDRKQDTLLGGTVGTLWKPDEHLNGDSADYYWRSERPLRMQEQHPYVDMLMSFVWKGDGWEPGDWWPDPKVNYTLDEHPNYPDGPWDENWPIDPIPYMCSGGYTDPCPYDGSSLEMTSQDEGPQPQTNLLTESDLIQLDSVVRDYALDTDGNGRFDQLIVDVEVTVRQPGRYTLGGMLYLPDGLNDRAEADPITLDLPAGTHTVQLSFDGETIGRAKATGPYTVDNVWISDDESFDIRFGSWDSVLVYEEPGYMTQPYAATQFETVAAQLVGNYSHRGLDSNGDGRYEAVAIDIPLEIADAGTYQVEGDLYDSRGDYIGHATWSGSGSPASLEFSLAGTVPPYKLENLRLYNAQNSLLDSRSKMVYSITDLNNQVNRGPAAMDLQIPAGEIGALGEHITPTLTYSHQGSDTDSDGLYNQLIIDVGVEVTQAGQYRVEGWLEAADGTLLTYGLSAPVTLNPGTGTLSLPFDGRAINGQGYNGPYSVVDLKILDGGPAYTVLDEVNDTGWILNYNADDFDPADEVATIFGDDMESGTASWTGQAPWTHTEKSWPVSSYVWTADTSSQDGSLTSIGLDLTNYVDPLLIFQNSYQMASGDTGYVEVSPNGTDWTTVATYTNSLDRLETALVDLTGFGGNSSLQVRFNADATSGLEWIIDNLSLIGGQDSDGDGIPDDVEGYDEDTDGDGKLNYQDRDDDGDGLWTDKEDTVNHNGDPTDDDTDGDGIPDYLDRDDDNDGLFTDYENADPNNNGDPQDAVDTDNDGIPDYRDPDDDGDGVNTDQERSDPNGDGNPDDARNTDGASGDTLPDYLDPDDDGDGVNTGEGDEDQSDPDGDGVPNYLDPSNNTSTDDDGDGVDTVNEDWDEDGDPTNDDSDNDNIPDYMDPDASAPPTGDLFLPIIVK